MNFNKDLWNNTEAKEFGEFETLELGGHEVVILHAEEYTSEYTGNTSLKVEVDIAGTDKQKGFFKNQFDKNESDDKKWPASATKYLSLKDDQLPYLKGFITALEKSNNGFKFNPQGDWSQIENLKLAAQFGLEEFEKQDGSVGVSTKINQFRSLDKLKDIKVPKVKLINKTTMDYEEYKNNSRSSENTNKNPFNDFGDVVEITDDFLD